MNSRYLIVIPQVSDALFISSHSIDSLLFRLDSFSWPIFIVTDTSSVISIVLLSLCSEFFISFTVFSALKFPFASVLYIFFYLLWQSIFAFILRVSTFICWRIIIIATLESLSDNSNICVILSFASVDTSWDFLSYFYAT